MTLSIFHKENYSRKELLLRSVFGYFYIRLPHGFVLSFVSIWISILNFLAFWVLLFTGEYPKSWFELHVKYLRWGIRVSASDMNLIDGYPAFGFNAQHPEIKLEVPYPPELSRVSVLIRAIFGYVYVILPHMFCLFFRIIISQILTFLSWWVVLFTGSYPKLWHTFNVGTLRWSSRISLYLTFMTKDYPPFSGI